MPLPGRRRRRRTAERDGRRWNSRDPSARDGDEQAFEGEGGCGVLLEIAPSLGRNLAACGTRQDCTATATVPLITPQTQFEDRLTQLDLRLTRTMRLGPRYRLQANFDVYNVFNASAMLTPNNTYGSQWRVPVTTIARGAGVLNARLFQFSGRLSF